MNGKPPYRRKFDNRNQDEHRINHRIRIPKVRVVTDDGEQFGILDTREALRIAQDRGLDLVEVAPTAKPPVCKIMDYGKYKYREQKKKADAKKKRTEVTIKEIRMRYTTDKGDFERLIKKAREFLEKGDKVKFNMLFRGREMAFIERGMERFQEVARELEDIADIDSQSPKPGRQIFVAFAPKK